MKSQGSKPIKVRSVDNFNMGSTLFKFLFIISLCMFTALGCAGNKDPFEQDEWISYESKEHTGYSLTIGREGGVVREHVQRISSNEYVYHPSIGFHLSDSEFDRISSLTSETYLEKYEQDSQSRDSNLFIDQKNDKKTFSLEKSERNSQETKELLDFFSEIILMDLKDRETYMQPRAVLVPTAPN